MSSLFYAQGNKNSERQVVPLEDNSYAGICTLLTVNKELTCILSYMSYASRSDRSNRMVYLKELIAKWLNSFYKEF
jgi:hypothetical protein